MTSLSSTRMKLFDLPILLCMMHEASLLHIDCCGHPLPLQKPDWFRLRTLKPVVMIVAKQELAVRVIVLCESDHLFIAFVISGLRNCVSRLILIPFQATQVLYRSLRSGPTGFMEGLKLGLIGDYA